MFWWRNTSYQVRKSVTFQPICDSPRLVFSQHLFQLYSVKGSARKCCIDVCLTHVHSKCALYLQRTFCCIRCLERGDDAIQIHDKIMFHFNLGRYYMSGSGPIGTNNRPRVEYRISHLRLCKSSYQYNYNVV